MIECIFVGDVMPGAIKINGPVQDYIMDSWTSADIVLGNLESPLVNQAPYRVNENKISLWSNAQNIDILKLFRFSHFCLNNNHIFDLYANGLDSTVSILRDAGINGFGINYGPISQIDTVEVRGIKIGMVAFNWVQSDFTQHLATAIDNFNFSYYKKNMDFLVCFLHWGDDHNIYINQDQQLAARKLIDQGVDIIIGAHPHVPQGWEVYKNKYIFYSLGNFIFTPKETYDHLLYEIKYADERENILFQRTECKIGLYVKMRFSTHGYKIIDIGPTYREHTLPCDLPHELETFYTQMLATMNSQIKTSNYQLNESYKKKILLKYTLPLIIRNPYYWPIFFEKFSLKKSLSLIRGNRIR